MLTHTPSHPGIVSLCLPVLSLSWIFFFCLAISLHLTFSGLFSSSPPSSSYLIDPPWEVASPSHCRRGPLLWQMTCRGPPALRRGKKSFKLRRRTEFDWMQKLRGCILASCIWSSSGKKVRNTGRAALLYHTYCMFEEIMTTNQTLLTVVKQSAMTIKDLQQEQDVV